MSAPPSHLCTHLVTAPTDYVVWFTGEHRNCYWVCPPCADAWPTVPDLVEATPEARDACEEAGCWEGIRGHPAIRQRATDLRFEHVEVAVDTARWRGVAPAASGWWILLDSGRLARFDAEAGLHALRPLADLTFPLDAEVDLRVSPCGAYAVVLQCSDRYATVHATADGRRLMLLDRGDYRPENSDFPVAFFRHEDRTLLVSATEWNRVDVFDPATGACLTPRELADDRALNYFHASLCVSPDGRWIADAGWVWHPAGLVTAWPLDRWLADPGVAEDRQLRRVLNQRAYFWDGPMCWIDDTTLAVWGWGEDDEWLLPAVELIDVVEPAMVDWFPGPQVRPPVAWPPRKRPPALFFDTWLFAVHADLGVGVWDVETGEHLHQDATIAPVQYHPGERRFVSMTEGGVILSRLIGSG